MNPVWVKVFACIFAVVVIGFFGYNQFELYSLELAVVFIVIACGAIFYFDKINWAVFKKPRQVLAPLDWKERALASLEDNYPDRLDKMFSEVEILESVPIGILYVYDSPYAEMHEKRCVFGEVWKDSNRPVLSPLETLDWHRRYNDCRTKREIGELYLGIESKKPLKLLKETKKEEGL